MSAVLGRPRGRDCDDSGPTWTHDTGAPQTSAATPVSSRTLPLQTGLDLFTPRIGEEVGPESTSPRPPSSLSLCTSRPPDTSRVGRPWSWTGGVSGGGTSLQTPYDTRRRCYKPISNFGKVFTCGRVHYVSRPLGQN